MHSNRWRPGNYIASIALVTLLILLQYLGDDIDLFFRRDAILGGELYPVISGHLVHINWLHLALNLAGLTVTLLIFPFLAKGMTLPMLTLWSAAVISAGMLLFFPSISWYAGFSGVLHAILTFGALRSIQHRQGRIVLIVVIGKVSWELFNGALPGSSETIGAEVVTEAHLLGVVAGAAAWPLRQLFRNIR